MKRGKYDVITTDRTEDSEGNVIKYYVRAKYPENGHIYENDGIGITKYKGNAIVTDLATGRKLCSAGTVKGAYTEYLKLKDRLEAERATEKYREWVNLFNSTKEKL